MDEIEVLKDGFHRAISKNMFMDMLWQIPLSKVAVVLPFLWRKQRRIPMNIPWQLTQTGMEVGPANSWVRSVIIDPKDREDVRALMSAFCPEELNRLETAWDIFQKEQRRRFFYGEELLPYPEI